MALTATVFLSFYNLHSVPFRALICSLAKYSFDMYLFSYIVDVIVYPYFLQSCGCDSKILLMLYFPVVVCVLLCSWILARIKERIFRMFRLPELLG